jgi:hypothetical protein
LLRRRGGKRQDEVDSPREKELSEQSRREKCMIQPEELQKWWEEQGEEVFATAAQWRTAHPKATLIEIEQAGDRAYESAASTDDRSIGASECRRE